MSYANIDEIRSVIFNDNLTITEIANESSVLKTAIGKYRRGESAIENMSLSNAIKLQNYYLKLEEENNMTGKISREESFGRAFAVLDIISARTFDNGGRGIEIQLSHELWKQPMTVLFRAHKRVMEYTGSFKEAELELLDRFNGYISAIDIEDYNDNPLDPAYLIYISKESVKLRELIKNKELY